MSDLHSFLNLVNAVVGKHHGVTLDYERHVIDFGSRAQYRLGRHDLAPEQTNALRKFAPELLAVVRSDLGQK